MVTTLFGIAGMHDWAETTETSDYKHDTFLGNFPSTSGAFLFLLRLLAGLVASEVSAVQLWNL
ncbi:MAG: hypothetical protein QF745_03730, partial [Planctomycetota bacterium]|nr:hypothetical protein [Planctomycetota bacterium]